MNKEKKIQLLNKLSKGEISVNELGMKLNDNGMPGLFVAVKFDNDIFYYSYQGKEGLYTYNQIVEMESKRTSAVPIFVTPVGDPERIKRMYAEHFSCHSLLV